jgi:hypothetical protein
MTDVSPSRSAADDIQSITHSIYLYCRAVDRLDVELGNAIWHDDGKADYGPDLYQGSGHGFIEYVLAAHAAIENHSHQVSNVMVTLDGDRAASESYVTAFLRMRDETGLKEIITRGRYLDRWSFRGGRWAIDKRLYIHDFDDLRSIERVTLPSASKRDRSDPSYAALVLKQAN